MVTIIHMINVFKAGAETTSLSLAIINNNSIAVLVPFLIIIVIQVSFVSFCISN